MSFQPDKASKIPGLIFRHFQGESDFPRLAEVLTASEVADHQNRHLTASDLAQAFQHMTNCDPFHDLIVAEVFGKCVGYTRGWWEQGEEGMRLYCHNGFLVPEWRHLGIGTALLAAVENQLLEIASTHPQTLKKIIQISVNQDYSGRLALIKQADYLPVRYYFSMLRPNLDRIADFNLPEGLEVRPVTPADFPVIWELICETSQDEWGHRDLTEQDYQEWLSSPLFQSELWQVAWDMSTNQPVGTVLTYIHHEENQQFNRLRGYTEGIGVLKSWRRRGVARALISRSLQVQKAAGMTESALVVDSENESNATRLYESCGFQVVNRDTLYRKSL